MKNKFNKVGSNVSKGIKIYLLFKDAHKKDLANFLQCGIHFDSINIDVPKRKEPHKILNVRV